MVDKIADFQGHISDFQYSLSVSHQSISDLESLHKPSPSLLSPSQGWQDDAVSAFPAITREIDGDSCSEIFLFLDRIEQSSQKISALSSDLTDGLIRGDTLASPESHKADSLLNPGSLSQQEIDENVADTLDAGVPDLFGRSKADAYVLPNFQIETESGEALDILSIEVKGGRDLVVRVDVLSSKDDETRLKEIESRCSVQLRAKDDQINQYRLENERLWKTIELIVSRPINVVKNVTNTTNLSVEKMAGSLNTGSGTASASGFTQKDCPSE